MIRRTQTASHHIAPSHHITLSHHRSVITGSKLQCNKWITAHVSEARFALEEEHHLGMPKGKRQDKSRTPGHVKAPIPIATINIEHSPALSQRNKPKGPFASVAGPDTLSPTSNKNHKAHQKARKDRLDRRSIHEKQTQMVTRSAGNWT